MPGSIAPLVGGGLPAGHRRAWIVRGLLFAAWLALVVVLSSRHVFWRDEVRGLSFALQGNDVIEMFRGVRGDGHPLLWFLLLRGGHALLGPAILPVLAFAVALAATALLLWRGPFPPVTLALFTFSHLAVWEYAVMARNYGISMLLMFVFAAAYPRWRSRGIWLILPLALLTQTNVHSAMLAWGLLGVWLADIRPARPEAARWIARRVLPAAAILALATLACLLTIWPPFNDAAVSHVPITPAGVIRAMALPGFGFVEAAHISLAIPVVLSLVLLGSLGVIWGRPFHLLAALAGLCGMSLLFTFIYSGGDRHRDLWLVYLVALYWMRLDRDAMDAGPAATKGKLPREIGRFCFHALFLIQVVMLVIALVDQARMPFSRSRELARLLSGTPGLSGAIVIADPDFLIEPLPYYAPGNPLWRIRQGGFGAINHFTSHGAKLDLTLEDITATARRLQQCNDRPVVIVMQTPPAPDKAQVLGSGYNWTTRHTPAGIRGFLASSELLARFGPAVTDESYAVYRLREGKGPAPSAQDCGAFRLN